MPFLSSESLARTYRHPSKEPWDAVRLYRQAMRRNPDWGATRVATDINTDESNDFEGISRGEIRSWVDGDAKPDAARAIGVAEDLGWLEDDWTPTTRALAQLVAGVFACGSVDEAGWVPGWVVSTKRSDIEAALEQVGVGHQHIRRNRSRQGDEIRPRKHRSILGRALVAAGAPVGHKTSKTVRGLPQWLGRAPPSVRASFAELLVAERGSERPGRATLQIQANRSREYFDDVRELIEDVTGESVTASDSGVTISADAVRALGLA